MKIHPANKFIKHWSEYEVGDLIIVDDNDLNRRDDYLTRNIPINSIIKIEGIEFYKMMRGRNGNGVVFGIKLQNTNSLTYFDMKRFKIYE